jgi:hypothetical protein
MVNLSYHAFAYEVVARGNDHDAAKAMRQGSLTRSILTLVLFTTAMLLSLKVPYLAFALVTCVLLTYARPGLPTAKGFVKHTFD